LENAENENVQKHRIVKLHCPSKILFVGTWLHWFRNLQIKCWRLIVKFYQNVIITTQIKILHSVICGSQLHLQMLLAAGRWHW
jgi:hypothetical protein